MRPTTLRQVHARLQGSTVAGTTVEMGHGSLAGSSSLSTRAQACLRWSGESARSSEPVERAGQAVRACWRVVGERDEGEELSWTTTSLCALCYRLDWLEGDMRVLGLFY